MTEIKTKTWTTIGTFFTFLEADRLRSSCIEKYDAIKVKRGGKGGGLYKVKVWNSPPPENKKSNKRSKKNDNKKIRARQKQT